MNERINDAVAYWAEPSSVFHDHVSIIEIGKENSRACIANSKTGEVLYSASLNTSYYKEDLSKREDLQHTIRQSLLSKIFLENAAA